MPDSDALGPIHQIALPVQDVERATTFYRDILGLPFLYAFGALAFFDCDGVRLMLSEPEGETVFTSANVMLYFRAGDIAAMHRELMARGVRFEEEPHVVGNTGTHDVWLASFRDSEENLLALMSEIPVSGDTVEGS